MQIDLSAQRVVVTGAAGFIGLHLLHGLHAAGAEVVAIVIAGKPTRGLDALPFPVERIVIESDRVAGDAVRRFRPRYVVHLNAVISLERSFSMIEQTIEANVISTI